MLKRKKYRKSQMIRIINLSLLISPFIILLYIYIKLIFLNSDI